MPVIGGAKYATRPWCITELFVYIRMCDVGEQQISSVFALKNGCNAMLVLSGAPCTSHLWNIMELLANVPVS